MRQGFSIISLMILVGLASCFPNVESDLEKMVERDDRLLQEHLQRNNIDAIETPLGYYYRKLESSATGNQIVNNDIVGVYYELRTIDGQLIETYMDESLPPRIFSHSEGGLVPRAMNFAAGLAKEGELFELFVPSYLAFQDYSFQNLIFPNSNLRVLVKYAQIFTTEEMEEMEENMILDYLSDNNLEGFEKSEDGLYIKIISEGEEESDAAQNGNVIGFTFQLYQLGEEEVLSEMTNNQNPVQLSLGSPNNLKFINLSILGQKKGVEFEVISPSKLAYGATTQVFPFQVRRDLFDKNYIPQIARPFEPVKVKFKIIQIGNQ